MKFLLLVLYIWLQDGKPTPKLDQIPAATTAECAETGKRRIVELENNPNFVGGLFAGCVELPVVQAKR